MARALRIQYSGAWYHVMHRGASHQEIYHDAFHFHMFLDVLKETCEHYKIEVHAYCLMNNHYHLLLRTPLGNLSSAMRHLNGQFTQKYNKVNKKDGALFRGRYKAILIDAENYLLELSRYIHLNPVRAEIVELPDEYFWSSYRFYVCPSIQPEWLNCIDTLNYFGPKNQIENYQRFVLNGIEMSSLKLANKNKCLLQPILGSKEFVSKVKNKQNIDRVHQEIPGCLVVQKNLLPTVEEIINEVSIYFGISPLEVIKMANKKQGNTPRKIAVYLSSRLGLQSGKNIAPVFESVSYKGVSKICSRIERELDSNLELNSVINAIKDIIIEKHGN